MIISNQMVWLVWVEIALGLLVIAFGALVRGNFLGMPVNSTFRLAGIIIRLAGIVMGTGILLIACGDLLSHLRHAAWSRVDRNHAFLAETVLGILGPLQNNGEKALSFKAGMNRLLLLDGRMF
jgi:hypothetical protein